MTDEFARNLMLYTLGTLCEMKRKKIITGGSYTLSKQGMKNFKQLKADGFTPTQKEIDMAMAELQEQEMV